MKKLTEIYGYVAIKKTECPFHFNSEDFTLKVYPPTRDKWYWEKYDFSGFLKDYGDHIEKKHERIKEKTIKGVTSEEYNIYFGIGILSNQYNGFKEFKINWVIYFSEEYDVDKIDGLKISGGDINLFYPACKVLNPQIELTEEGYIKEAAVFAKKQEYLSCGKYEVSENVFANVEINAIPQIRFRNFDNPIDARSSIIVNYSEGVGIKTVLDTIQDIKNFFYYTCYRNNILFSDMDIYWHNPDKKMDFCGKILLPTENQKENHKDLRKRIITYDFWGERMADMLMVIKKKLIEYDYIPDCINNTRIYPSSRFIAILAEFEREYRNIYGTDNIRSDDYKDSKKKVIDVLNDFLKDKKGKEKKYIKSFIKTIENSDDSYESRVNKALKECQDIMEPFINVVYKDNFEEAVDNISERMGSVRNGFMHSRLDLKIEAIHLEDIRIVEKLTYAIRLKTFEEDNKKIYNEIKKLFGEY